MDNKQKCIAIIALMLAVVAVFMSSEPGENGINGTNGTNIVMGTLTFALHNISSDVTEYSSLKMDSVIVADVNKTSRTFTAIPNGQTLLQNWTSLPMGLTLIPAGAVLVHIHALKIDGIAHDDVLNYEIGIVNSTGGNFVSIGLSDPTLPFVSTTEQEFDIEGVMLERTINTTDRMALRLYVNQTGTGALPDITIYMDDLTVSRLVIPAIPIDLRSLINTVGNNTENIDLKVNKTGDIMIGVLNFSIYGFEMSPESALITTYSQFNGTVEPFIEVDANNYLNFINNRLEWTGMVRTSKNYVYHEVGVSSIPNTFNMTWDWNNSRGTIFYSVNFVGVSQQLDDLYHLQTSTSNYIGVAYSGNTNAVSIVEKHGAGAQTASSAISVSENTNYTMNLTVVGTVATMHVYTYQTANDIAGSPVTLTATSQTYRYAFITSNYNDGATGVYSGWIDNMYLQSLPPQYTVWCVKINEAGVLYSTPGQC